jgi:4-amino-4-deoxy-L-arabinose transferase-like glycosyltransferase
MFTMHAMTDVPFIFFMISSVYFFVLTEKTPKTYYVISSGLFFGLAILTKQGLALLIPIVVFLYLVVSKRSVRFFFTKRFTLFWGTGLAVLSPWLIYMSIRFGSVFWQWYFMYSDVMRTVSPLEGHSGGFLYYFNVLVTREPRIWVVLLPFAAALCFFNSIKRSKADILVLTWMATVLLIFSLAQTKIYYYALPAYPAFAFAIAALLYQTAKKIHSIIPKKD